MMEMVSRPKQNYRETKGGPEMETLKAHREHLTLLAAWSARSP